MPAPFDAARAYAAAASHRTLRQQEADVFRRANALLRQSRGASPVIRARALADNGRLWLAVLDLVRDPANDLPIHLRAGIASIGLTVQRELNKPDPDIDFLVTINDSIAAGLATPG